MKPRSVLRASMGTVGARALDLPSRYGFHLLIAIKLGVVQAGAFYVLFSVITLAAGAGRLGVDRAMTREVARAMAQDMPELARRIVTSGVRLILLLSGTASLLLLVGAIPLAMLLFGTTELSSHIAVSGLIIFPLGASVAAAGALAGLHRVGWSQMIYSWLWPALFCVTAFWLPLNLFEVLVLVAAAATANAAIGFVLLWVHLPRGQPGEVKPQSPPLLGLGLSLFTTELTQILLASLPALVLGLVATDRAVGLFSLAWRLALILNILITAVSAMAAPRFADLHVRGDQAGLRALSSQSIAVVVSVGALPWIVLFAAAGPLLGLFGAEFEAGAATLRILLVGQFIAMCATAVPELLGMTGFTAELRRINFASAAALCISSAVLASVWSEEGAAIAVVVATYVNAATSSSSVTRNLGFTPLYAAWAASTAALKGIFAAKSSRK